MLRGEITALERSGILRGKRREALSPRVLLLKGVRAESLRLNE